MLESILGTKPQLSLVLLDDVNTSLACIFIHILLSSEI